MVIHKAVGMAYPVISFIDLLDGIEKTGSVLIVFEDGLLFISSGCYVIYCSWVFYTEGSDHNRYLSFRRNDVKKIDLTLSFRSGSLATWFLPEV